MPEALVVALGAAALAVALSYAGGWSGTMPRSSGADLVALAGVVGCCTLGSQLGYHHGYSFAGSLLGAVVGAFAAAAVRRLAR